MTTDNWKELARQHAESKMPEGWDRKDEILVGIFYTHYINFIDENYNLDNKKPILCH